MTAVVVPPQLAAFIRKARQASHQALYFLRILESARDVADDGAVADYARFAAGQLRAVVSVIAVPNTDVPETHAGAVRKWASEIRESLLGEEEEGTPTDGPALLAAVSQLRGAFESFLCLSAPKALTNAGRSHLLVTGLKFLRKNLLLFLGLLALIPVLFLVEVVNSLFLRWDVPIWIVGSTVGLTCVWWVTSKLRSRVRLLVRVVATAAMGGLMYGGLHAGSGWLAVAWFVVVLAYLLASWPARCRIARGAFFSLRRMALQPERGLDRWPSVAEGKRPWLGDAVRGIVVVMVLGVLLRAYPGVLGTRSFVVVALVGVAAVAFLAWGQPQLLWTIFRGVLWRFAPLVPAGLCLWGLHAFLETPGTVLTVYGILVLGGTFLLVCHALDFWDFIDPWPIRTVGLACGVVYVLSSVLTPLGSYAAVGALLLLTWLAWHYTRERRTRWVGTGLFLCAAALTYSGGLTLRQEAWDPAGTACWEPGSRASATTAWDHADYWPHPKGAVGRDLPPVVVIAASGGGSRAALYTAMTLEALKDSALRPVREQIQLISSVSGGSLANAAYVARRYRETTGAASAQVHPDTLPLPEVVGDDYLLPTLWGALVPGQLRGRAIEAWWRDHAGLDSIRLSSLARAWNEAPQGSPPPFPLPVFNSCSLDGHGVVISPLGPTHYLPKRRRRDPSPDIGNEQETWVYDRDALYDLAQLTTCDPALPSAVRASANFPFGFPLVTVLLSNREVLDLTPRNHPREDEIQLTDGGVLSNSGMWPVYQLLTRKVDSLKARGVLLIVVEASKMPTYGDLTHRVGRLYGAITDKAPHGQGLHWQMLERLYDLYGGRFGVVQIDLIPDEEHNVLTSWALGTQQRAQLDTTFRRRWVRERPRLCATWNALVRENPAVPALPCDRGPTPRAEMALGTDRPPVN